MDGTPVARPQDPKQLTESLRCESRKFRANSGSTGTDQEMSLLRTNGRGRPLPQSHLAITVLTGI
jgi:hypothetical protein